MRAPALAALVGAALIAGCGASPSAGGDLTAATTGLVLTLHFSRYNVQTVSLSGATYTTSRRFGPYVVNENDLPRDSTVGFVFDPSDAGTAMVCGESRDFSGQTMQQGCDTFNVVADDVTHGSLTLIDPN